MIRVPAQVEPYVEALGIDMAVEFLIAFGGTVVIVSPRPTKYNEVARRFGVEASLALSRIADRLPRRVPQQKAWAARVLHASGLKNVEIARRLNVSDEMVRQYLAKPETGRPEHASKPPSDQLELPF